MVLRGGDADGNAQITITDITQWKLKAANPNSDQYGDSAWTEQANFDGDNVIGTDDFSVWYGNRDKSFFKP